MPCLVIPEQTMPCLVTSEQTMLCLVTSCYGLQVTIAWPRPGKQIMVGALSIREEDGFLILQELEKILQLLALTSRTRTQMKMLR
jgi:hypothetical protein